jgi:hypothetical protein
MRLAKYRIYDNKKRDINISILFINIKIIKGLPAILNLHEWTSFIDNEMT